jgi:hypothetical protein
MALSAMTPVGGSPSAGGRPPGGPSSHPQRPSHTQRPAETKGPGAVVLLFALPLLCCGGPALFAALAAASAATLGAVGGIVGVVLLAVATGLVVRHRSRGRCCAPTQGASLP